MSIVTDIRRVTQRIAAEILGVSARTLRDMPEAPRNRDGSYSLPALVAWRLALEDERAGAVESDADSPLDRFRKARAELTEMDLAERRGELLRKHEVCQAVSEVASTMRDGLLGFSHKLAPRLHGLPIDGIAIELDTAVREVLEDFQDRLTALPYEDNDGENVA